MSSSTSTNKPASTNEGPVDMVLLAWASLQERLGNIDGALDVYNSIVKRNPSCVTALAARSIINLSKGQDEKAYKDVHKAVGAGPRDRNALRARALTFMLSSNFDGALRDLIKALDSNDWDSLTCLLAYIVYPKTSEAHEASTFLNSALDGKIKIQEWPFPVLQFYRNDISMTDLMNIANSSKGRLLETRGYLGFQKVFLQNPEEGKVDLQFVYSARSGSTLVRTMAARGLKIIQEGHAEKLASRREKADRTTGMDWMD